MKPTKYELFERDGGDDLAWLRPRTAERVVQRGGREPNLMAHDSQPPQAGRPSCCALGRPVREQARRRQARRQVKGSQRKAASIRAGCPHLTGRLSGPTFERMRECTDLLKTKQPRNFGYMQLAVIKVTNRKIAPQLMKYFSEVQPFIRKLSRKRSLAHSETARNVFREPSS